MEVDVWQLPIPDWGLHCPECRYRLNGLPSHCCPECGTQIHVPSLIRTWSPLRAPRFTGRELPYPDFGLHCGRCDQRLAGAARRVCPQCDAAFGRSTERPAGKWFAVEPWMTGQLLMPVIEVVLADQLIPFFTRDDKTMLDIYFGGRSIGTRLVVASEFYFDFLWTIAREHQHIEDGRKIADSERWTCPRCGEIVPGNFEVCWNCAGEQ